MPTPGNYPTFILGHCRCLAEWSPNIKNDPIVCDMLDPNSVMTKQNGQVIAGVGESEEEGKERVTP